jgi:transcriptional regulator with XRE-family HTH domain
MVDVTAGRFLSLPKPCSKIEGNTVGFVRTMLDKKFARQHERLSHYLKLARRAAQMTQREAGAQMGRDQTFIAKIESEVQCPLFVEIEQLARTYGKELKFFMTIEEIEKEHPDLIVPEKVLKRYPPRFAGKLWSKRSARRPANKVKRSKRT